MTDCNKKRCTHINAYSSFKFGRIPKTSVWEPVDNDVDKIHYYQNLKEKSIIFDKQIFHHFFSYFLERLNF